MIAPSLDIEQPDALIAYLRETRRIGPHELPRVTVLAGGVSNRTVLVERPEGEAWVLKQALGKLRVAVDWFADPARVHREAMGMRWLAELAPPGAITPLIFEDVEHHLIAMAAVPTPHENWKTMLLAGRVESDHVRQFSRLLGAIHRHSAERCGEIAAVFDDRSFFQSLRLEPYYAYTAEQAPAAGPFLQDLISQTLQRRLALVHGDYSPKNVLIHAGRLVLLDHEVIHFGDPAFDVGFGMTHLLSKARHVAGRRQAFIDAAKLHWRTYCDTIGGAPWAGDIEPWSVRHTLGCLLGRVAGRSLLEYLSDEQRAAQRDRVVEMMLAPPADMNRLIDQAAAP